MQAVPPEMIQVRAYELWEQDGRPDGMADEYWHRATTELANGNGVSMNGAVKTPRKKTATAVASEPAAKPKKKVAKAAN